MSLLARRIADNLADVRERIERASSGRDIRLVCVTKYAAAAWVEHLLEAGASELGENLLPAAAERFTVFRSAGYRFTRHLLGAQQSRKARSIPAACDMFQALDRLKIAELLQAELASQQGTLDVLLEVNADAEPQKAGWAPGEMESAVQQLSTRCPNLRLRGLMSVPRQRQPAESLREFEARIRRTYGGLRGLFDRIAAALPSTAQWDTLSMGMTQDYAWAIAEGATLVRVGSALFAGLEG